MILKNDDTRKNVLEGAEVIYDAVRTTLGPKGRNVLIRDKFGSFTITHDGVTVAKAVQMKDDPKSIGIELVKEASKKMDQVGDGTTTVTVLTYHLIKEASKLIEDGLNPMMIRRKLEAAIPLIIKEVEARSKKISKTKDDVKNIATVSVGSEELGEMVADLMQKVGFDGAISVDVTQSLETSTQVVEGYSFDRGYMSPHFINNPGGREAILRNPAVIVVNATISNLEDYQNVLNPLFENNIKDVLIIADNIEADALVL